MFEIIPVEELRCIFRLFIKKRKKKKFSIRSITVITWLLRACLSWGHPLEVEFSVPYWCIPSLFDSLLTISPKAVSVSYHVLAVKHFWVPSQYLAKVSWVQTRWEWSRCAAGGNATVFFLLLLFLPGSKGGFKGLYPSLWLSAIEGQSRPAGILGHANVASCSP